MAGTEFARKAVEAGLNDGLFSVQGHTEELHDSITRVKGSFKKITQAMENLRRLGVRHRCNITIIKKNYQFLPEIAEFFVRINPRIVNMILFLPSDDSADYTGDLSVPFSIAAPYVHKAIDIMRAGGAAEIDVKHIPFCFMKGYEEHVSNNVQLQYDEYEWDQVLRNTVNTGVLRTTYHIIEGLFLMHPKRVLSIPFYNTIREAVLKSHEKHYRHGPACQGCAARHICCGLEERYV